ncbi:MAG: hypothetical protein WCR42_00400 [bacterium]
MKKTILILFALIICSFMSALAEYNILDVPALPTKSQKDMYDESGIYMQKLMEYYTIAANYETLIKLSGLVPVKLVPIPSQEQLEETGFKNITLYYNLCRELQKQYKDNSLNFRDKEIENLATQLKESKKFGFSIQSQLLQAELAKSHGDFYRDENFKLLDDVDKYMFENDSLRMAVYGAKREMYERMKKNRGGLRDFKYPVLTVKAGAIQNFYYSANTDIKTGIQTMLVFNPGPMINIGEYFDLFGGADFYSVTTDFNKQKVTNYSYGLDLVLPFSRLVKFDKFGIEAKFGVGFFHANATAPNTALHTTNWHGQMMRFELDFFNFGGSFPIGIYSNYSLYNNRNNISFPIAEGTDINIGNNWTSAFTLGVNFPLWNLAD